MKLNVRWLLVLGVAGAGFAVAGWFAQASRQEPALAVVVMDPLAKPLACACVGGYAQRDYGPLAEFLSNRLRRRFEVVYAESLDRASQAAGPRPIAAVVGKASVVEHDSRKVALPLRVVASLIDSQGSNTLQGLFIVRTNDPAQRLADLTNRTVLFGPVEAQEKHGAAFAALREAGIDPGTNVLTRAGCSDAALEIVESQANPPPVAVISSYALPLLEGCGSVPPGAFRVIGRTGPVPFIRVFINPAVLKDLEPEFRSALEMAAKEHRVIDPLERGASFHDIAMTEHAWPGWRGTERDGQAAWLPEALPRNPRLLWKASLRSNAMGGLAVAEGKVMVGDRDPETQRDLFHCFRAGDGAVDWQFSYSAPGNLDYGAAPRAVPQLAGGLVYTLGAFGALHCLDLRTGQVRWKKELTREFGATPPRWGYAASPLIVDDLLIVNPGGPQASVVALDRLSGRLVWKAPGAGAAYAACICGTFGAKRQVIGYDSESLGGWDTGTGKRLWKLEPQVAGDFNVPTPIAWQGHLIVSTENNGSRMYGFNQRGEIIPEPLAQNSELAPDCATGVLAGKWLVGCGPGLRVLELPTLKTVWSEDSDVWAGYASLMAAGERVLALTFGGEMCLFSPRAGVADLRRRVALLPAGAETYAHPALLGEKILVRSGAWVACYSLTRESEETQ